MPSPPTARPPACPHGLGTSLTQAIELAVEAKIGFAVLNLISANPGMRWDIEETKKTIARWRFLGSR
jgi:hypothetical protein